jgi:thymidylate synthase
VALPILRIEDVIKETKDIPCTLNLQFLLRDNKLNMIVNMRSNDIIWGLPYDLFVFTNMQEVVANTLGVELGWYLHRPGSLHLYKKHYDLFKEVGNNFSNVRIKNPMNMINWVETKDDYKDFVNGKGNGEKFNKVYSSIKSDWIVEND